MNIKRVILALLLAVPLSAGNAIAGSTKNLSLIDAVKQDDREAVRSALKDVPKGNLSSAESAATLIWAVTRNDTEVLDLLLRVSADVNAANEYGATALYASAASADSAITEKLLAAGADPNAHLLSGETPLMQAARRGNLGAVRALLSGGGDANAREGNGGQNGLMWAISERHSAVAEELIRHGADAGARSKRGFTALMFAAQQGDLESARLLLHAGANPNDAMSTTGLTALLIASAMANTEVATLLLENGADPNIVDGQGFTALHRAAQNKAAVAIVRALLSHGANPNVRLVQEKPTILISGVSVAGATPLVLAGEINNYDAVVALADGGADPLIPTEQKTTALILAAGGGTDVSHPRPAEERATAVRTVKFLVERGSDVNAAGQFGWTALHAAAYQGLNDVVAYLAGKGANLDAMDEFGQTPLSIANAVVTKGLGAAYYQTARTFHRDTAELLLKLGATPLDRSGVVAVNRRAE